MIKQVPRVYIFHLQNGKTETLIGYSAAEAWYAHGKSALSVVDYYEAPGDEL